MESKFILVIKIRIYNLISALQYKFSVHRPLDQFLPSRISEIGGFLGQIRERDHGSVKIGRYIVRDAWLLYSSTSFARVKPRARKFIGLASRREIQLGGHSVTCLRLSF